MNIDLLLHDLNWHAAELHEENSVLSDLLTEAVAEIERLQKERDGLWDRLNTVKFAIGFCLIERNGMMELNPNYAAVVETLEAYLAENAWGKEWIRQNHAKPTDRT